MEDVVDLSSAADLPESSEQNEEEAFEGVWSCFEKGPRNKKTHRPTFAKCRHCCTVFDCPKILVLETHILDKCSKVPESKREQVYQSVRRKLPASLPPPVASRAAVKRQKLLQHSSDSGTYTIQQCFDARKAPTGKELQELRQAQLLFHDLQVETARGSLPVVNTTQQVRAPTTGQFAARDVVATLRANTPH